ncbi:MAG: DNA topoisomerase III [Clostridia bacterium]|nr:DNA topoisomerase III [Clostridia bacterium]
MHTLVVAEKPSVGRDIARVLGAGTKGDNCLTGNGYVVSWAVGHLVTLKEPDEIDPRYKHWRKEDLPIIPEKMETKVISKTKGQFSVLKKLMNDADVSEIVCATDSGREGELIFRYIYDQAKCKKPVKRLWISSMTEEAIRSGFAALRPSQDYDNLYKSARCRADADWLIGMNATRAFTIRYNVILSIGRVQTPTLSMLVKRRREIDAFVPTAYFTVRADFGDYEGIYIDANGEKQIPEKAQAETIAGAVKGKPAEVTEVVKENKSERPPLLYDLTTLQREANSRFGYSAKKTLQIAQDLYEKHKLLTYPRTDSRFLSHDMQGKVRETLSKYDGNLKEIGEKAVGYGITLNKRVFDDAKLTDHHAIIPTGKPASKASLTTDERNVYEMVATRLAAVFYPNYEYESTRVTTRCEGYSFQSQGKHVTQPGWRELTPAQTKKGKKGSRDAADGEGELPQLSRGDTRTCKAASVKEEATKPPKEHNDASLLAEMEHAGRRIEDENLREQMKDCGLGTPATRAAIIERLIEVGYVKREKKNLVATEKGCKLIDAVPVEMASPEITGQWEKILSEISKGADKESDFRTGIVRMTEKLVGDAAAAPDVGFTPESYKKGGRAQKKPVTLGIKCPLCGKGEVAENRAAFYCTRFREGCKYTVWKNCLQRIGGPEISEKLIRLCLTNSAVKGSTGTIYTSSTGVLSFVPGNP